ncbi:MAG: phospholipid/cholesterol/gamma-HCH transport system substrate-binding protein [Solirubrobacteraceae bacterium]|nr:phospholipid/cholesterol/gamma-HCH transport system substrate-binding protein [Solirubrobacteraceae bacterium]
MPRVTDRRRALGAALLLGALAATVLAWQRPNPVANDRTVRALFADASGIAPVGAEVRMAGTPVGKITGRERRGDAALVTMTIDRGAGPIARDATAELRPRLLFEGTAYVDLTAGSPGAPDLGSGVLPLSQTHTYVSVADTFDLLGPDPARALRTDAHELRRTLAPAAAASLRGTLATAPALTRDLETTATAALGPHGDDLQRTVAGAQRTAAAVAGQRRDLLALSRDAGTTAAAADGPALGAAIERLPTTVAELRAGGQDLAGTLTRVRALAAAAVPGANRLAPPRRTVRPLLREALPGVRAARPLVDDLDAALRSARTAAAPTRAALDALSPTVDLLAGGLLSALERPTSLGTPAYIAFMGLFAGGGGASRPFTPGAGHFMRFGFRFLSGVGAPVPPCTLLAQANAALAAGLQKVGGCQ